MGRKANIPSKETEQYILANLRYDPETGHLWWVKEGGPTRKIGQPAGHNHAAGYIEVTLRYGGKQYRTMAHRIAWFLYYGCWPKNYLDHINNNKKDNRIENLREATHSQNMANRPKMRVTDSKTDSGSYVCHNIFVGVYRIPSGSWVARHKKKHLGTFDTPEEAALAYNKEAKRRFGDFAHQNDVSS